MGTSDGGLSHMDVREAVADAATTLFAHGVMSRTGRGDLSRARGRSPDADHPRPPARLTAQALAMVSLDSQVFEGELDSLKMEIALLHAQLYRLRPDIGCIIHTHSPYVLAFALANRPLPCNYEAMRFGRPTEIPVIPWRRRGTPELIDSIVAVSSSTWHQCRHPRQPRRARLRADARGDRHPGHRPGGGRGGRDSRRAASGASPLALGERPADAKSGRVQS